MHLTSRTFTPVLLTVGCVLITSTAVVYADCTGAGCLSNPLHSPSIGEFLKNVFQVVMKIGMIVVSIAIVLVGFQFVMAQGRPKELAVAKTNAKWTIIGAALIMGAWVITTILSSTINGLMS